MSTRALVEVQPKDNRQKQLEQQRPPHPKTVLQELFALLEEYGPEWYKLEHHNRAVAAMRESV